MGYTGSGMGGLVQGWRQADEDQQTQARNDSYLKTQTLKQTRAQQGIDEWSAGAETRDMKRDFEKSKMVATQALQSMTNIPDQNWGEFQARAWSALPVHGTVRFDPEQNRLLAEDGETVPTQSREEMADLLAKFADPNAFVQIKTAELKRKETPTQYVDAQGNVRTMKPGEAGAGWNRVEDRVMGQGLQQGQAQIDSTRAQEGARKAQQGYYRQQQDKAGRIDVAPGHVVFGPEGQEIARGLQKGGSGSGSSGKNEPAYDKDILARMKATAGFLKKAGAAVNVDMLSSPDVSKEEKLSVIQTVLGISEDEQAPAKLRLVAKQFLKDAESVGILPTVQKDPLKEEYFQLRKQFPADRAKEIMQRAHPDRFGWQEPQPYGANR